MSLAKQISQWICTQVENAGAKGITFGLSGGVDSACIAALAKDAPGLETLAVLMPCHSAAIDAEYAHQVAETFDLETLTVDLTPVYDAFITALPPSTSRMAQANLKPRLRMSTLYYIANVRNYLVVGTSNKSEWLVGYFTKQGDSSVDILPIADLYKREVYDLARELGVPQPIIDRAPTAGLWAGQTDEEEMGLTYDTLERALLTLTVGGDYVSQEKLDKVRHMMTTSAHKRVLPPMFVKEADA